MLPRSVRRIALAAVALASGLLLAASARRAPRLGRRMRVLPQAADARWGRGWGIPILGLIGAAVLGGGIASYTSYQARQQQRLVVQELTRGEPDRAPPLLIRYGCAGCHTIPGVPGAIGQVGPALAGFATRVYIGGTAANRPNRLIEWLVDPPRLEPNSAMPATGISNAEARDVAAYLYTLR